jgi:uncharacterized Zn finger protein
MSILTIDEPAITAAVSGEVLAHGRDYEAAGAVLRLVRRGSTLEAIVQGTRSEPYRLRITVYADGHFGSLCTCPYAAVPCKHVVAALLHYLHEPDRVPMRPDLIGQLVGLDRGQLLELVLHLLDEYPGLADAIDAHLANGPEPLLPAVGEQPHFDAADVAGSRLETLVHTLIPEFVPLAADYLDEDAGPGSGRSRETSAFDEFAEVQEVVQVLAEAGDPERALEVLGSVTAELVARWPAADAVTAEDRSFTRAFFTQVAAAWTQMLAQAKLPSPVGQAWANALDNWQQTLQPYGLGDVFAGAGVGSREYGVWSRE